jgi:hypothetical protein
MAIWTCASFAWSHRKIGPSQSGAFHVNEVGPRHRPVLAHQVAAGVTAPRAVEAGLLDPGALAAETDVAQLLTIAAIERWLTGAEKAGAAVG